MHALHGFLGRPTDFNFLPFSHVAHDLFSQESISQNDLSLWSSWFNKKAEGELIGYSLGARLGLLALLEKPKQWKSAILIGPHLGIVDPKERMERIQSDWKWAERFLRLPWSELIELWEAQEIFKGGPHPKRSDEIPREYLASALFKWSLGLQPILDPLIQELDMPILLVYGEKEKERIARVERLKFKHPASKIWIAPDSSHRIPWSKPKELVEEINAFKKRIQ